MRHDAMALFDANLRGVTRAVWTRDLELILEHIGLPHQVVTADRDVVLATPEDMETAMHAFRDQLGAMGATEYRQINRGASFVPGCSDTIVGTHETRLLRGEDLVSPPYLSRMTMIYMEGAWKSVCIEAQTPNAACRMVAEHMAERHAREMERHARAVIR